MKRIIPSLIFILSVLSLQLLTAEAEDNDSSKKLYPPENGRKLVTSPLFTGRNSDLISQKRSIEAGYFYIIDYSLESFNPVDTGAVIGSLDDLADFALEAAGDEKISFWLMTGHGWSEPTSIAFSDTLQADSNVLSLQNAGELAYLKELFTEDAIIVLATCKAADCGEGSIAAKLSEIWKVHVYAADMTVHHILNHESLGLIYCSGISSEQYFEFFPMIHFFNGKIVGDKNLDPMRKPIPKPIPQEGAGN